MFEVKVTIDASPVLTQILQSILSIIPNQVEDKTSNDKDEKVVPKKQEKVVKNEAETEEKQEDTPSEKTEITFEEIRALATKKMKDGKGSALKELLKEFGVEKLSEIKESDYKVMYDRLGDV